MNLMNHVGLVIAQGFDIRALDWSQVDFLIALIIGLAFFGLVIMLFGATFLPKIAKNIKLGFLGVAILLLIIVPVLITQMKTTFSDITP